VHPALLAAGPADPVEPAGAVVAAGEVEVEVEVGEAGAVGDDGAGAPVAEQLTAIATARKALQRVRHAAARVGDRRRPRRAGGEKRTAHVLRRGERC
jgi:hypothetical protein